MFPRRIAVAAALAVVALALFLAALWSPERQVRLHQEHLLTAVSKKKWQSVAPFIAENYSDRWGHDKAFVLDAAREAFSQFFVLEIVMEKPVQSVVDGRGEVSARLIARGSGGPVAQLVIEKLQELRGPFTFRWQKQSGKPWDWAVVQMDQPALEVPEF